MSGSSTPELIGVILTGDLLVEEGPASARAGDLKTRVVAAQAQMLAVGTAN
jgi:hypothetical protein